MKFHDLDITASKTQVLAFVAALFGVLFITSFLPALYFYLPNGASVLHLTVRSALIGLTPILLLPFIYLFSVEKPIFDNANNIALHVILSLLLSFLSLLIFQLLIFFLLDRTFFFGIGYSQIESILVKQFFSIGSILFFTYLGLSVLLGLNKYYRELGQIKKRSNELESQLEAATLSSLRAQLKPHFLFNTLSMVDQMIATAPDTAIKMVDKLEKLLQTTFDRSRSESCTLKEEISFIRKYLAIETHRFDDRLEVQYNISPATAMIMVPRYLLQPLVENALVHGVGRSMEKCIIRISSKFEGGRLLITIEDSGPGMRAQHKKSAKGIGIKNVRKRLELYYGKSASLKVGSGADSGFKSQISIPYRYLSTAAAASKPSLLTQN